MTDLEKLWDDVPTNPAPIDNILRQGRKGHRSPARKRQPFLLAGAAGALATTFAAGLMVGGGTTTTNTALLDIKHASFQADLAPATSCDDLLTYYKDKALELVSPFGWVWGLGDEWDMPEGYRGNMNNLPGAASSSISDEMFQSPMYRDLSARKDGKYGQSSSQTGTNVQEAGIDEPDLAKTDGRTLVRLRGSTLWVYDVTGSKARKLSTLAIPRITSGELLLSGETVVVIGQMRGGAKARSRVVTVSLAEPTKPSITHTADYASQITSARQHGSVVRLVMSAGLPEFEFVEPRGNAARGTAELRANRKIINDSTIDDWLPTVDTGDGPQLAVDCTNIAIPNQVVALDTTTVVGFDVAEPAALNTMGIAAATSLAYESDDHLFLAWPSDGKTYLFDFELAGTTATHVASGDVDGDLLSRWAVDENDDVLRLAISRNHQTGNFNSVVTLQRDGTQLMETGRLDRLGVGEDIKSVRWFDDVAVVVTFRTVDPLYTVDLSKPTKPTLLGELKIPGYSEYLHPIGNQQLLGIGYTGNGRSAQIGLFDSKTLTDVKQTQVEVLDRYRAVVSQDTRAFTWLDDKRTALTTLHRGRGTYLLTLKVTGQQFTHRIRPVDLGTDHQPVRTLPLPGGKVALVTDRNVEVLRP